MSGRDFPLEPDHIYHIYNRGVNKEDIFFSDRNYQFFIRQMYKYLLPKADIYAFCLMPNHFHLLLKVNSVDFVEKGLQLFLMSFSKAINSERDRVGPLFQGRYKANLIVDDAYLVDCFKYIHLNPVKAFLVKKPEMWTYSSYSEYLNPDKNAKINTSLIMQFFNTLKDVREFVESGIEEYQSKYFKEEI